MMNVLKLLLCIAIGYLLGSFSFSIVVSRVFFGKDVRQKGSGNAGATNMARSFGIVPGLITLLADMIKTFAAAALGRFLLGENGVCIAGSACIIGHCFPVYYGFKGGKGVSAGFAIFLSADVRAAAAAAAVFLIVAFSSRKVSLGSLTGALAGLVVCILCRNSAGKIFMVAFTVILIFYRHSENIGRLLKGKEPDFRLNRRG